MTETEQRREERMALALRQNEARLVEAGMPISSFEALEEAARANAWLIDGLYVGSGGYSLIEMEWPYPEEDGPPYHLSLRISGEGETPLIALIDAISGVLWAIDEYGL